MSLLTSIKEISEFYKFPYGRLKKWNKKHPLPKIPGTENIVPISPYNAYLWFRDTCCVWLKMEVKKRVPWPVVPDEY